MMEKSVCPYCGNEMQLGYFGGAYAQLEWIPEGRRRRVTLLTKSTGITLNKINNFQFHKVYAYHCSSCNVFIINDN